MAFSSRTMILAFAGVLTPLLARGQGKSELRGRVVSETGEAIAGATITLAQIGYAIRTDSTGAFQLAGTPGSTLVFTLRAAGFRGDTAAVTLPRRAGLSQEFKLVSEATALPEPNPSDRVLRGSVTDLDDRALAYASVQVNGGRRYLSDDSGRFTIPPPAGRFSLLVRRIGFAPEEIKLDARPDTAIRVRMTAVATALPEQRITGRAAFASLDLGGFYRRMKDAERGINHGFFITPEDFEFRRPNLMTQMAENYPAVYVRHNPVNPRQDLILGTPCSTPSKMCVPVGPSLLRCVMTVYLDRVRIAGKLGNMPDDFVNELVLPTTVAAMEIYPRGVGAPPEYQPSNGSCGVVLIWSK
jgi:hypothetical protein